MDEKFVTPCELPSDHEKELLTIFIEECAEAQQRATKMLRFGVEEVQPGQPLTNKNRLGAEVGDLMAMIGILEERGLLNPFDIAGGVQTKRRKLKKYLQTEEA